MPQLAAAGGAAAEALDGPAGGLKLQTRVPALRLGLVEVGGQFLKVDSPVSCSSLIFTGRIGIGCILYDWSMPPCAVIAW